MTLRHGSVEDITTMFATMDDQRKSLLKRISQLVYFMRGAVQYHAALTLTYVEREILEDTIKERLEVESNKVYPNY